MSDSQDDVVGSEEEEDYDSEFIDDDDDDYGGHGKKGSKKDKKGGKKKKKQKMNAAYFLEEEAAEDSDEDSGADDEMDKNTRKLYEKEKMRLEKEMGPRRTNAPDFLKYERGEEIDEYFKHAEENDAVEETELALLPTPSDPKLFAVKCKFTEERDACAQVMKKYFECLNSPAEFQIFSVTSVNKTQGYIYIEAFSNKHVFMAVANIPIIYGSNVTLVNFADRTQIFEVDPTRNVEIKIGQWVRVKKGIYDGDLAQVVDTEDNKGKVLVKLVPRLMPENTEDGDDHKDDDGNSKAKNLQKARNALKNGIKPAQKLFQENEYQEWSNQRDAEKGLSFILYKNNRYCDGLLYKNMPMKNLVTQNITVTYEESKFFTIGESTDYNVLSTLVAQGSNKPTKFFKGDRIMVTKGELMNLEAEIIKISPTALTVKPKNTDYEGTMEVAPSDCIKSFVKGEYVRVVEGKNAGKEGFVLTVEDNIATVMSDGLQNMIQVFVNDLVFCNDSTRNIDVSSKKDRDQEQEYMKFDLVKLNDRKTVGIVLGTANMGWKILDNFGNVRNVTTYQIEQKLNTRNTMTKNDKNQTFRINDSVRILQGKYKGQTGIIKHIYSDLLFVYNPDVAQNMGVIIEKVNNCFLLSSQRTQGRPNAPKTKDSLVGVKCTIKSGPWKGYQGIVKDGNERTVSLELTAKCQIIAVKRELVIPLSEIGKSTEPAENRNIEPKTPMIGRSLQSPMFNSMNSPGFDNSAGFGNSPAWGFDSPVYEKHI